MPSIYDVARYAKVSAATVSLTVNSKGKISERTRKRVLAACTKLRYQPHPTARFLPKLRSRERNNVRSGLFAFTPIIEPGTDATYVEFLNGVAKLGIRENKMIVYQPVQQGQESQVSFINGLGIDGRLVIGLVDDHILELFQSQNRPLVVMGDHQCKKPVWNVALDHHAAGQLVVQHLWGLDHRRLALFCQSKNSIYQSEFKRGFVDALTQKGLREGEYDIIGDVPSGDEIVELLRRTERRPTAVIAIEGGRAAHTLMRAREMGLKTPDDFSLMLFGQGNTPLNGQMLTYMDPCQEEIGRRSTELVMRLAENETKETPSRTLVSSRVVEGETCAAPGASRSTPHVS